MSAIPLNLRFATTKLAFDVPELRRYLLPLLAQLKVAKTFPSDEALKKYLDEHPGADRNQHSVEKSDKPKGKEESKDKGFGFNKDEPKKETPKGDAEGKARDRPPSGSSGWSADDDDGNTYWGKATVVGEFATVKNSQLAGKVSGKATVEKSKTSVGSRIGENAEVRNSVIDGLVEIGGDAKITGSKIDAHNITIGGDTQIEGARIEGGNWDGQKVKGGRWADSYDQDIIDILSQFNSPKHPHRAGTGDGAIQAMIRWLSDGGSTKGLLGGKKKRKKMEKAIAEHMRYAYSGNAHIHAQEGVQHLERLSDEDFDKLMEVAGKKADEKKSKRKGKKGSMTTDSLRRDLIKLASANPEIRSYVLPLLGKTAMEHATEGARKKYLQKHPKADPKRHTVKDDQRPESEVNPKQHKKMIERLKGEGKSKGKQPTTEELAKDDPSLRPESEVSPKKHKKMVERLKGEDKSRKEMEHARAQMKGLGKAKSRSEKAKAKKKEDESRKEMEHARAQMKGLGKARGKTAQQALRNKVIRLAAARPDLRPKLLPLLSKKALNLSPGNGFEDDKSLLRFHRYMSSLRVTDLTNAGKRGKKVEEFALYNIERPKDPKKLEQAITAILKARGYKAALALAQKYVNEHDGYGPSIEEGSMKGVHVAPAGFKKIKLDTEHVTLVSDYQSWTVFDKRDRNNLPACRAEGAKSVKSFYRWVSDNEAKVKKMTFSDIMKALTKEGIEYRQWCRMD